ncbi:MAG: GntR family transcriptional regulator [Ideonella sp.]|nr:GntR family transcriptional regulator [Ideonella sp.]
MRADPEISIRGLAMAIGQHPLLGLPDLYVLYDDMNTTSSRKGKPLLVEPTPLQRNVVAHRRDGAGPALPVGTAMTELSVARDLGVSRTPARAALAWLASRGMLERKTGEGFLTVQSPAQFSTVLLDVPVADSDRLFLEIARERNAGDLPTDMSEADLMRRFAVTRPTLLRVLARLAEVGMVERRTGHGWHLLPNDHDDAAQLESYRFRMLVEPAALLEPGFAMPTAWLEQMRQRHRAMLQRKWKDADAIDLFEMNAEFHEGLAAASGNRFLQMAIQRRTACGDLSTTTGTMAASAWSCRAPSIWKSWTGLKPVSATWLLR